MRHVQRIPFAAGAFLWQTLNLSQGLPSSAADTKLISHVYETVLNGMTCGAGSAHQLEIISVDLVLFKNAVQIGIDG